MDELEKLIREEIDNSSTANWDSEILGIRIARIAREYAEEQCKMQREACAEAACLGIKQNMWGEDALYETIRNARVTPAPVVPPEEKK